MDISFEEWEKLNIMKFDIIFFQRKLEKFIRESDATDDVNLLMLLDDLKKTVQSHFGACVIVEAENSTKAFVDHNCLSYDRVFECSACNMGVGRTYKHVIRHISNPRHIKKVKQYRRQNQRRNSNGSSSESSVTVVVNCFNNMTLPPSLPMTQEPNASISSPMYPHQVLHPSHLFTTHQEQGDVINNFGAWLPYVPHSSEVIHLQQNFVNSSNNYHQDWKQITEEAAESSTTTEVTHLQQNFVNSSTNYHQDWKQTTEEAAESSIEHDSLDQKTLSFLNGNYEQHVDGLVIEAKNLTDEQLYQEIIKDLEAICKDLKIDAKVECYGSRIMGIGSIASDVNVNITAAKYSVIQYMLLNELRCKSKWKCVTSRQLPPLISVRHVNSDLECSISFNNEMAMINTKLVKYLYSIQPECQKLVVFIIQWMKTLNFQLSFNKYVTNLLVFFYFQSIGLLPKVMDIVKSRKLPYWPDEFTPKTLDELGIEMCDTFNELCIGFMNFYGYNVAFETTVLSTFTGTAIPKSLFGTVQFWQIYDCFDGLRKYTKVRGAKMIERNFTTAMCIQDPFRHNRNVSHYVFKENLYHFKKNCQKTLNLLQFKACENQ